MRKACVFFLAAVTALGQPAPDVSQILNKVAATYRDAKDYEIVMERTQPGMKMRTQLAVQSPDRIRVEITRVDLVPPLIAFRAVWDRSVFCGYLAETNT